MNRSNCRAALHAAPTARAAWRRGVPLLLVTLLAWQSANAGSLRERIAERRAARAEQNVPEREAASTPEGASRALPAGVTVRRDLSYGRDPRQRYDLYLPPRAQDAPVLFMVHGGGRKRGDKAMASVVDPKVAHWVPQGVILVSVNYRMLPETPPLEQARDVARALAAAQAQASSWGGARGKFVLVGHSAGAHLVTLLAASPSLLRNAGAAPVLGTIALDSAIYDVEQVMRAPHARLYDDAFGADPKLWADVSPYRQLEGAMAPLLAVCSAQRKAACPQAQHFTAKAQSLDGRAQVLALDMSHREINLLLGQDAAYTREVDQFLRSLDTRLAQLLAL
ncbi:alpha/beta hydrolase [Janthinobacterium sp. 17J80-10]|uniref:alpha/beta hydrolase n=1 Tax=Janthinobacterium sp. 17J80-10 TaxID=2497863 RepID=UPI001005565D|nr:alpha/beta hydrolase [Janthinobacterium sp. 17J80-10]QAU32842.1 alpha/beta hydrolase [Janthinobacterium sp. 17J80-10]